VFNDIVIHQLVLYISISLEVFISLYSHHCIHITVFTSIIASIVSFQFNVNLHASFVLKQYKLNLSNVNLVKNNNNTASMFHFKCHGVPYCPILYDDYCIRKGAHIIPCVQLTLLHHYRESFRKVSNEKLTGYRNIQNQTAKAEIK